MATRSGNGHDRPTDGALTYLEILRGLEPSDRLRKYVEEREADLQKPRQPAGFQRVEEDANH